MSPNFSWHAVESPNKKIRADALLLFEKQSCNRSSLELEQTVTDKSEKLSHYIVAGGEYLHAAFNFKPKESIRSSGNGEEEMLHSNGQGTIDIFVFKRRIWVPRDLNIACDFAIPESGT
ncbi:hypothetical protein RRG08_048585 [Elysia crispata]|uniref:Uncharacterized protein n=1 Tax=Elysia crispata TaxID=231223 RepID=A0AAE1EAH1_9GAST|nr:hypothetical protein RRG08_048585 [Elysia crispata]